MSAMWTEESSFVRSELEPLSMSKWEEGGRGVGGECVGDEEILECV